MYIMGENPAMSDPDQTHARQRAWIISLCKIFSRQRQRHLQMTLPARLSCAHGHNTNTDRRVQQALSVNPPGEARQDWWIIQELANRLGLSWTISIKDIFGEMRLLPQLALAGIGSKLKMQGYPCADEHSEGKDVIFGDAFPTPSGRGKMTPADTLPPDEQPFKDFLIVMPTGRLLEHWHTGSMTRRATVLCARANS